MYVDQKHKELHTTQCLYTVTCNELFLCSDVTLLKSNAAQFLCSNNKSIDRQYVCDLHKDCPEGEDEEQDCGECDN